jgi:hypothetical protein
MGTGIIIGMAGLTVASAITQKILSSVGKMDESSMVDLATKSGLACTALAIFVKFIKVVATLG